VVSARPSVVAAAGAPAQLAAGQAVTGRIASIDDKGAILTLSPGVRSAL
jgi:ribosomal protein S1